MKKLISISLAIVLALCLVACGAQNDTQNNVASGEENTNSSVENQQSQQEPEKETQGDEEKPADSGEVTTQPAEGEEKEQEQQEGEQVQEETPVITASHSDVTFKAAGSSFVLQPQGVEGTYAAAFSSADESVAAVDASGTVTAVAPGTTTITMHVEGNGARYDFTCIIRCNWEAAAEGEEEPGEETSAAGVDLSAFFVAYIESLGENAPFMMEMDAEITEAFYPGLTAIAFKQRAMYMAGMSAVPFEFALIELENNGDAEAVKAILQSRIDYQAGGGAWYPETVAAWEKAEIVVSGDYIAMIVAGEEQSHAVELFKDYLAHGTLPVA